MRLSNFALTNFSFLHDISLTSRHFYLVQQWISKKKNFRRSTLLRTISGSVRLAVTAYCTLPILSAASVTSLSLIAFLLYLYIILKKYDFIENVFGVKMGFFGNKLLLCQQTINMQCETDSFINWTNIHCGEIFFSYEIYCWAEYFFCWINIS